MCSSFSYFIFWLLSCSSADKEFLIRAVLTKMKEFQSQKDPKKTKKQNEEKKTKSKKQKNKTKKLPLYLQFQIIVPFSAYQFLDFLSDPPLSYLDPMLINFPHFVLQIFQILLKRFVLNKEPQNNVSMRWNKKNKKMNTQTRLIS